VQKSTVHSKHPSVEYISTIRSYNGPSICFFGLTAFSKYMGYIASVG